MKRLIAALGIALLAVATRSNAAGFDRELFDIFVDANMGAQGEPVYYYSTGTIKTFPGGKLLANIEGVDMARLLRRDADGTVHKASRKFYILRDPATGEVIDKIDGKPNDRYFYPYQYMTFRLDGDRLVGTSTQGRGAAKRQVDIGSAMEARRVGDLTVFSAPNARESTDGTGSYEMYEFWVTPKRAKLSPSAGLTLTLVNWHPIGQGKPVYTHRTSWRVDRYADLPESIRRYIESSAPLYREPPRDFAEIEQLQAPEPAWLGRSPTADVVASMTREEKVNLVVGTGITIRELSLPPEFQRPTTGDKPLRVTGAAGETFGLPRLGIPSITLTDGPAGVRIDPKREGNTGSFHATAFPIGSLLASSWDPKMASRVGAAMGREARAYGVDVLLAPALNLHRNPLGGRNFEYYSEDPLLSGRMAAAAVKGIQSEGVGATLKHFVANDHEWNRYTIDVKLSERALREIYLRPFEIAVRESSPWAVMSSYNKVNGTYTSENERLLDQILRNELGFRGAVMTDWFGGTDPVAQMKAGNHLLMPGTAFQQKTLLAAAAGGALDEFLDRNAAAVLELVQRTPRFRGIEPTNAPDLAAHAEIAREAAGAGMVLLENEGVLPLAAPSKIALFGNAAYDTLIGGSGSGDVNEAYAVPIASGLTAAGFILDEDIATTYRTLVEAERVKRQTQSLMPQALVGEASVEIEQIARAAVDADVAIAVIGRRSGEFADRSKEPGDFALLESEKKLLRQVSRAFRAKNKPFVVVLNIGGVIETASWRMVPDAILLAWQPGQEAGHAIADILSGKVNPSGKLSTTFPITLEDVPSSKNFPGKTLLGPDPADRGLFATTDRAAEISYDDDIWVGYRHYATRNVRVAYPFGFGLSYTQFAYSDFSLGGFEFKDRLPIRVTVTNTGKVAGREVVQLYVSAPEKAVPKPELELKAFAKTKLLAPGESETLFLSFTDRDLAYFDTTESSWKVERGSYTVRVGASSEDIRGVATFSVAKDFLVK